MNRIIISIFMLILTTSPATAQSSSATDLWADSPELLIAGRHQILSVDQALHSYPGVRFAVTVEADSVVAELTDMCQIAEDTTYHHNTYAVIIDGEVRGKIILQKDKHQYTIAEKLSKGKHTIELVKLTESLVGQVIFHRFILFGNAKTEKPAAPSRTIEFIGNSITCGYGIESTTGTDGFSYLTENAYTAYAMQAARRLSAEPVLVSFSGKGIYRNWADTVFYQETMLELYPRVTPQRPDLLWDFDKNRPDAVVVSLGTNDFSPPLGAVRELFVPRYLQLLRTIRNNYGTSVPIICLNGPLLAPEQRAKVETWIGECLRELADPKSYYLSLSVCNPADGWGADGHPSQKTADRNAAELSSFMKTILGW